MDYIEIGKNVFMVILGGLAIYIQYNKKIQEKIAEVTAKAVVLIKQAEELYADGTKEGGKRFEWVVNRLYDLVPPVLKTIITQEMIENIVQSTFDEMERYAKTQLDKLVDKEV